MNEEITKCAEGTAELINTDNVEVLSEKPAKKPRIHEVEMVRAIAFIATIFRHSLAAFIYDGKMDLFAAVTTCTLLSIARFGTPTFLFVTGFVLLYNYEHIQYGTFLKKRFTKVIIPYVFWSVIYFLFIKLASAKSGASFLEDMKTLGSQIIHGSASYHLWFIIMILQFYILFPLFRAIILKFRGGKKWVGLLVGTVIYQVVAMWIYSKYLPGLTDAAADGSLIKELLLYRDRSFLLWILYFMLGGIFAVNYTEIRGLLTKYSKLLGIGAFLSLCYIVFISMNQAVVEGEFVTVNYMLTSPVYLRMVTYSVLTILTIFVVCTSIIKKNGPAYPILRWIGKLSFGGYLVHAIYINLSARAVNHFFGEQHILICVFLTIVSTFICSIVTTYIFSKVKLGKYLIGA